MQLEATARCAACSIAMLLVSTALAQSRASLQLRNPVSINGQVLSAGDYELQWNGKGHNVQVSILQGEDFIARFKARVIEQDTTAVTNKAVTVAKNRGPQALVALQFQGTRSRLLFQQPSAVPNAAFSVVIPLSSPCCPPPPPPPAHTK
jgi:hypothetical protein